MPRGLPLWKPPYSRMTAIDMNVGEHLWMTPLGNGDRIRNHPQLCHLALPPVGGDASRSGPLVTETLLMPWRDEGEYREVFDRGATERSGMHRRPNGTVITNGATKPVMPLTLGTTLGPYEITAKIGESGDVALEVHRTKSVLHPSNRSRQ